MTKFAILGAGAWGTALAITLARRGRGVTIAARRSDYCEVMSRTRENPAHLPGIPLSAEIELTADWSAAVTAASTIVMAIPSRFARAALAPVAAEISPDATLISVTKGIEPDSLMTMSQMLAEIAPQAKNAAILSGPGFAAEVASGKPAALVAAARVEAVAREVQELFAVPPLRVYRSADVSGVELGGAIKNVIAIAAGISDGLELGASARAALITRGLAEIMRLAEAVGARRETIAGLAGLGDLVLTCTGDLSRNRRIGLDISRGRRPPTDTDGGSVAEGIANSRSIRAMARRAGVETPIVEAVYRILYEAAPAGAMVKELLSRELKAEFD
jgi:glycerol-3-phosphate dehydrogenase (NAD(P)+)